MISLDQEIRKDKERDTRNKNSERRGRQTYEGNRNQHYRKDNRRHEGRDFRRREERPAEVKLLVKIITKEQLQEICEKTGKVKNCRILWDKSGRSKEVATVEYFDKEDTERAVHELRGQVIEQQAIETELEQQSRIHPKRHEIRRNFHQNNRFKNSKNFD